MRCAPATIAFNVFFVRHFLTIWKIRRSNMEEFSVKDTQTARTNIFTERSLKRKGVDEICRFRERWGEEMNKEERNVSPKKRPNEQALPSYEDGYGIIDAEAEERALKSAAMMALPYEEIKHENGTFAPPKSPFKSPKLSGESTIVFRGMLIMNVAPTDGEPRPSTSLGGLR